MGRRNSTTSKPQAKRKGKKWRDQGLAISKTFVPVPVDPEVEVEE